MKFLDISILKQLEILSVVPLHEQALRVLFIEDYCFPADHKELLLHSCMMYLSEKRWFVCSYRISSIDRY